MARRPTPATPDEALRELLNPSEPEREAVDAAPVFEPPPPTAAPPPVPSAPPARWLRTTTPGFVVRDGFHCDVAVGTLVAESDRARYEGLGFKLEPAVLERSETFDGRPVVRAL